MRETLTSYLPESLDISAEDARGKEENLRADARAVNGSWGPERENFFMFFSPAVEEPSMRSADPAFREHPPSRKVSAKLQFPPTVARSHEP